jgi:hypothetical protein
MGMGYGVLNSIQKGGTLILNLISRPLNGKGVKKMNCITCGNSSAFKPCGAFIEGYCSAMDCKVSKNGLCDNWYPLDCQYYDANGKCRISKFREDCKGCIKICV